MRRWFDILCSNNNNRFVNYFRQVSFKLKWLQNIAKKSNTRLNNSFPINYIGCPKNAKEKNIGTLRCRSTISTKSREQISFRTRSLRSYMRNMNGGSVLEPTRTEKSLKIWDLLSLKKTSRNILKENCVIFKTAKRISSKWPKQ